MPSECAAYILKKGQHLVVCSIVRNEEANICVPKNSGNSDKTGPATWDNADILIGIFAGLAFPVILVVEFGNGSS